jgi:muramoyltetrapeptide carboxypeptidase
VDELLDIIFGRTKLLRYDNLTCLNIAAQTSDALEAKIVGGNLSIVQTSIGTDWQIDASDKILFLEDVSERGYRIDRMLNHLKQAGIMSNVKAVILGDFTDSKEKDGSDLVDLAIADFAAKVTFPVFRTPEIGHNAANRPLPLNTKARLTGGISPSLSVDMQEFWN